MDNGEILIREHESIAPQRETQVAVACSHLGLDFYLFLRYLLFVQKLQNPTILRDEAIPWAYSAASKSSSYFIGAR